MAGVGSILGAMLIALIVQREPLWADHAKSRRNVLVYSSVSLVILGFALVVVADAAMNGETTLPPWAQVIVAIALGSGLTLLLGSPLARQLHPATDAVEKRMPEPLRRPARFLWSYIYVVVVAAAVLYVVLQT